jgi:hypothetical protein
MVVPNSERSEPPAAPQPSEVLLDAVLHRLGLMTDLPEVPVHPGAIPSGKHLDKALRNARNEGRLDTRSPGLAVRRTRIALR